MINVLHRYIIDSDISFLGLEATEDKIWISKSCCCRKYTLRGVPAKQVDVLVEDKTEWTELYPDSVVMVCEVSRKKGRYDGAERSRLMFRWMSGGNAQRLSHFRGPAKLSASETV